MAMIMTAFAFNISAETTTVYVVGAGDGLTWDLPGKAYTGEDGVVSFTVNNLTKFKASLNNATDWDDEGGYNAGCYGPGATAFGSSVYPNGQTLPMVSWGEDIDLPWTGNYTITMDFNNNQITAKTSTPQPTNAPAVYIRGDMNGWAGTPAAWQLTNISWTGTSGEWSFTGTIPAGQNFKIADSSWGQINYTLNNKSLTPELNNPYTATYGGSNNDTQLATAFTGTVTLKITNYSGHVATITFSEGNGGTVTPSYPEELYIIGTINGEGWNPANVAAMTSNDEGVYTIESVTLGENGGSCGFAITGGGASWNDVNSLRFGPAVKDTKAVVGVNKVDGVGDVSWTIDPGTYKMVFDYDEMTLTITKLQDVEIPTPTAPEKLYIIGTIDGEGWNPTSGKALTKDGDIFTIENVTLKEAAGSTGFAFVSDLAQNNDDGGWNYINGLRYGPEVNNTEVTLDTDLPFKKQNSAWAINPGTYTFTVDFDKMTLTVTGTVDVPEPTYPDNLYLYGDVEGNVWNPTKGNLTDNQGDGLYVIEDVKIVAATNDPLGYFAFSAVQAENNDDGGWNYVNGSRYGTSETTLIEDYTGSTEYTLVKGGQQSFSIKPGIYTIYANLDEMTLTVEGEADAETPEAPEAWYLYTEANWGKGTEMVRQEGTTDKGEYVYKVTFPELSAPLSFKIFSSEEGQSKPAYGPGTNGTFDGTDVTLEAVLNSDGNFANWTLLKDATFTFYYNPAGQSWLQLQGTEVVPTVLYVKGDYDEWKGNIQLTRTSDELTENGEYTFSASVEALDGPFKISQFTQNWNGLNYGGQGMGENPNSTLVANGATLEAWSGSDVNFTADDLKNVTINFYYNPDKEKASWLNAVAEKPAAPEFFTVAIGTGNLNMPAYNPEGTKLLPTDDDPNIFEGTIKVGKSKAMAFYTNTEVPYTGTSNTTSPHVQINLKSYPNWPSTAAQIAQAKLFSNEGLAADQQIKMYVTNFDYPAGETECNVKISINWAEQSFSFELLPYVETAPEAIYLWGSVDGGEKFTNMATLDKADNADVYTLENFVVPACGIFAKDEYVSVERGFSFGINGNVNSFGKGSYLPAVGDNEINLTKADEEYTADVNNNDTGSNFIALTPGVYNFTFDYEKMTFTAELVTPYKQVQFDIVGGANITNPRQYVTAMTMGEEPETLKFPTNSKLFSYDESSGVLFALNADYQADYTLTVTGPTGIEESGDTYVITESDADGMKGTMLGLYGVNNGTFTITVAEKVKDLQLTFVGVNFNIEDTDINDYLTLQDQAVLMSTGGEDMGIINITSNPFNFVPNTEMGQYWLNLTHKEGYSLTATVAPGTPDDAQISVQDGSGNVVISGIDLGDNIGVIVTITEEKEPNVLYLAQPFNTIPAVDPQSIEETEPGVYEGVFKFKTGMSYIGFYTVDGDVITKYSKGEFGTFPADLSAYPLTDDLVKDADTAFSWYMPALPAGCQGNFNVTVNTNDLTITVDPVFEEAPAPENLYLWGSTNGGVNAVNMANFVKNENVYTLEGFEVPACGIFDTSDAEGGSTIDKGFSFFLCDNGTSFTAAGAKRYYGPKPVDENGPNPAAFELSAASNTYTATATVSGTTDTGGNFIALTPGLYDFTFNYATKEFKAVLTEEANQIQLNFVAEGNVTSPHKKVTVQKMFPEVTTLEISDPEYLFSYMSQQGLNIVANEGYTVNIEAANGEEPGTNFTLDGTDADGLTAYVLGLTPGANGMTFIVTVSEEVADENVYYLGIAEGTVPTAPNMDYPLTVNEDGTVTGEYAILPGQSFNIWYPANLTGAVEGDENEDNPAIAYQPLGPVTGEEVDLYFTTANTDVLGRVAPTMGYWTLTNEEAVTINFNLDLNTYSLSLEAVSEDLPEPEPLPESLYFEDWTMNLVKDADPATHNIEVDIQSAPEGFEYQGYQFDITLPNGLVLDTDKIVTAGGVKAGTNQIGSTEFTYTTEILVYYDQKDLQSETKNIITLPVSSAYGDIEDGDYDVVIENTVIFSTKLGQDVDDILGWTGTVTITSEVNATEVTVESVTLDEPSFTTPSSDEVKEVTQGQSVTMTVVTDPKNTTDDIEVTADVEGVTITKNEDGTWTVDTSGVDVDWYPDEVEITITVTATDSEGNVTAKTTYPLTVRGILLGDSNDNGEVTVADVVTTANYIAEKPIDNFNYPNANVILNDGGITVQDVTATVNIVLGTFDGNQNPEMLQARRNARNIVTGDRLVANKVSDSKIAVSLENTYAYAALQAEIAIPEGMKVYSVTAGERAAGFEVVYNVNAEGNLIVVLYNYTNATIADGDGSIFDINVTGNGDMDNCEMINIHASDAQSNGYDLDGFVNANGATGIDGIDADAEGVEFFTVDGIKVVNPAKGQILIRVANGEATKVLVK